LSDQLGGLKHKELLNIQLNLAAYLYNAKDYKRAAKVNATFPHDTATLGQLMGTEWRFKYEMFQLISFYDRGHFDQADSLLKQMLAYYAHFFQADQYARVETYLQFVSRMIDDPNIVTTDAFRQDVKAAQLNMQREHEDIQAIAFYCWLTSKMFQRDYYEVLLHALGWKSNLEMAGC